VTWRGVVVDQRTADMLEELARISGNIYINPTQGSWSGSVAASAGTHAGCGAVDLMHPLWSVGDFNTVTRLGRSVGFAMWHRTPQQSNWPRHCHGIAIQPGGKHDRGCLSAAAHQQVIDYYNGRNGLARHAPDDGPRDYVGTTWETYKEQHMALSDDDIRRIAEAVWTADIIRSPHSSETNPTWRPDSYLRKTYEKLQQIADKLNPPQ
jgi:hypothetical protein